MDHQDWNPVVLKRTLNEKEKKAKHGTETVNKKSASSDNGLNKKKLDDETETFHHKQTPKDKIKEITKLRNKKKWTQKILAQHCNYPQTIIAGIESGQAIYDHVKVEKILRVLRSNKM
tara:strand:- start:526 stop:879 length:354 start_codon:yes stop_codon:yes gene_type:complete